MNQELTSPTSPLSEAEPNSLDELFNRDPLELADQDIQRIVAVFRAQRKNFDLEEASAKKSGKKVNPSKLKKSAEEIAALDVDSLNLEL